jgi:hypothetical protein
MLDCFVDRDFQRRPHWTRQEVAAAHRAILQAKHRVEVKAGLAVIALRHIADQAEDFALLADSDPLVAFSREVEPANLGVAKAPIAVTAAPLTCSLFAKSVMALNASSPWSRTRTKVRSEPTGDGFCFHLLFPERLGPSVRLRLLNLIRLNDVVPPKAVNSHLSDSFIGASCDSIAGRNRPRREAAAPLRLRSRHDGQQHGG